MADRFIKHVPSGQVFIYAPPWIGMDDFTECANAAGDPLPEPEPEVSPAPRAPRAARAPKSAEPSAADDAALSADASRGLAAQGL
jgi:hypothetical protein